MATVVTLTTRCGCLRRSAAFLFLVWLHYVKAKACHNNDSYDGCNGSPIHLKSSSAVDFEGGYSAANRISGAAARTSASTVCSYLAKFFWNIPTSLRAVSSNAFLSAQV